MTMPWEHEPQPEVPRDQARMLEPGLRGVWMSAGVMVLLVTMLLPHAGSVNGWEVLGNGANTQAEAISLPSRLFVGGTLLFPVIMTALALIARRWALAWVAAAGSGLTAAIGLLAVWSRQTVGTGAPDATHGPGIGLLLMWVVVVLIAFHWVRLVWSQIPATSSERESEFTPRLRQQD
ncbi:MAG: hypothetical protein ABI181_15555 [Mycobacteriaceae bacterium]